MKGDKCFFWLDVWLGEVPLKCQFPALFQSCEQHNWTVARVFSRGFLGLTFNRSFTQVECVEWEGLGRLLENFVLTLEKDVAFWKWEANSKLSSKSLYMFILNPSVKDVRMIDMWKKNAL
jgi:hypothetical protein